MKNLFLFPIDDETQTEELAAEETATESETKAKSGSKAKSSKKLKASAASGTDADSKTATKPRATKKRAKKRKKTADRRERLLIEDALESTVDDVAVTELETPEVHVEEQATAPTNSPTADKQKEMPSAEVSKTGQKRTRKKAASKPTADKPSSSKPAPQPPPAGKPAKPKSSADELAKENALPVQTTDIEDIPNALPDVIENQIIRASAGTGKTYRLTSRYLRLLLLGAAPQTILATTFTRKAAGEILDRIVTWLSSAATDPKALKDLARAVEIPSLSQADCQNKLLQLTRQMHRLQIHTIDAFFMQMALSFSLELGMTPGWTILEEGGPESNSLRNEAIAGILRQESLEDLLVLVHQLSPKGEMKRGLEGLLIGRVNDAYRLFRDSTSDAWDKLKVPPPLPDDVLAEVRDLLNEYSDRRKTIMAAKSQDVTRIIEEDWRGFFGGGKTLVRNVNEGKERYGNAKLPEDLVALYRRFLPHLKSMILHSASSQTKATRSFLEKYHTHYRAVKEAQRLYSFDEVTEMLSQHTGASNLSRLSFRMDTGIDHLLLDEFQDTSIPQWRAFAKLAERCTSGEPGRSFFCVGDVKQAIYGWRGGSSEIFDLLDQKLPNLNRSELQDSRRSSPIIIDAVNAVFDLLPNWDEKKLGRSRRAAQKWNFPKHTTHCRDLPGHFTIETSEEAAGSNKEAQEEAVFQRAAERVAAISKQAPGRSIGILCRRNNKVAQMMNELQRLGIPASEEGGNYLTDSAAVELVLSLLHLVDHPADSISAFHLASSPRGMELGLRVDECPEITFEGKNKETGEAQDVVVRPPAGIDPKRVSTLIRRVRRQLLDDGFGDTIQGLAMQLRRFCNRREARRLTQLVEKAYEYQHRLENPSQMGYERQRRTSIRPTEFVRFIRETKVTDPSNATIRVMTVHQAKGLEFDVVILPDLLGPFVEGHDTFLYRRPSVDADIDLVCRYMGKDSGRSFLPNEFLPMFDEFEDRIAREAFCVLYVAMTRAVHAMHVFLPAGMQRMRGSKGHAGYLVKDAFAPGVALEPAQTMYESGDRHWFQNDPNFTARLPESNVQSAPQPRLARPKPQTRHFETVSPSQLGGDRFVRLGNRLLRGDDSAKDFGTVIHLWLSEIKWMDDVPNEARLRSLAKGYEETVDLNEVVEKFEQMLQSEPLTNILSKEQYLADLRSVTPGLPTDFEVDVRLEQPVAGKDQNQIVTGVIDRLVLVRRGSELLAAEIIDFKTESSNSSSSVEEKEQRYETQMAAYRRVIGSSLRVKNVTSRLVFL